MSHGFPLLIIITYGHIVLMFCSFLFRIDYVIISNKHLTKNAISNDNKTFLLCFSTIGFCFSALGANTK